MHKFLTTKILRTCLSYCFILWLPLHGSTSGIFSEDDSAADIFFELSPSDIFQFGNLWQEIRTHREKNTLYSMVALRRAEIKETKEHWRPFIEKQKQGALASFYAEVEKTVATGIIKPFRGGGGGVYIIHNALGMPCFVVKPNCEALLCLNNPKLKGSPFLDIDHRIRDSIPLYLSARTEALVYEIARFLEIDIITPPNGMVILNSSYFHDITKNAPDLSAKELCGPEDDEKLCSIQEYLPDSIDLNEAMHEWAEAKLEGKILLPIDQEDFEKVHLLIWLIYDNDAHSNNFRLYLKGLDENGKAYYGIKKIDNGLSLPEKNQHLSNYLAYYENAKKPLSKESREKISTIQASAIAELFERYELFAAKEAFYQRLQLLKILAQRPWMTIEEMNGRFELLCLPEGFDLAISSLSLNEIFEKVCPTTSFQSHQIEEDNSL